MFSQDASSGHRRRGGDFGQSAAAVQHGVDIGPQVLLLKARNSSCVQVPLPLGFMPIDGEMHTNTQLKIETIFSLAADAMALQGSTAQLRNIGSAALASSKTWQLTLKTPPRNREVHRSSQGVVPILKALARGEVNYIAARFGQVQTQQCPK